MVDVNRREARVQKLCDDLQALGLQIGDTVLIRAGMKAIGVERGIGRLGPVFLESLQRAVGPQGTVAALSFSKQDPCWKKSDHTFSRDSKSISGGFSQLFVNSTDAVRSLHPTNSIIAIGPKAEELVAGHDETSTCFSPIRKLVDLDGKMALVGCIDVSPGFSTIHLAQEELGIAYKSLLSGLSGSYYTDASERRRWFSRKDVPGCSMGFSKGYEHYRRANVLNEGKVGQADAMLINANDAYKIERELLEKDYMSLLCDDPGCVSCCTRTYNKRAWPGFALRAPASLMKMAKKIG